MRENVVSGKTCLFIMIMTILFTQKDGSNTTRAIRLNQASRNIQSAQDKKDAESCDFDENYLQSGDSNMEDVDKEIYRIEHPGCEGNIEDLERFDAALIQTTPIQGASFVQASDLQTSDIHIEAQKKTNDSDKTDGENVGNIKEFTPPAEIMNTTSHIQNVVSRHPWTVAILSMAAVSLFFFTTQIVMICAKKSRLRINKKDTERKLRQREIMLQQETQTNSQIGVPNQNSGMTQAEPSGLIMNQSQAVDLPSFRADDVHPIFQKNRQDGEQSQIPDNMNQPLLLRSSDITDRDFINEIEGKNESAGNPATFLGQFGDRSSGGVHSQNVTGRAVRNISGQPDSQGENNNNQRRTSTSSSRLTGQNNLNQGFFDDKSQNMQRE